MSEVKRFDAFTSFDDFKSRMVESKNGNYVAYSDYLSQRQQSDALQTSLNNIINAFGIKGEGAHSKLVIEYVHGLVAENAALKSSVPALKEVSYENDSFDDVSVAEQIGFNEAVRITTNNMQSTPATDAAIAEIKAHDINLLIDKLSGLPFTIGVSCGYVKEFAANLRAGRKG